MDDIAECCHPFSNPSRSKAQRQKLALCNVFHSHRDAFDFVSSKLFSSGGIPTLHLCANALSVATTGPWSRMPSSAALRSKPFLGSPTTGTLSPGRFRIRSRHRRNRFSNPGASRSGSMTKKECPQSRGPFLAAVQGLTLGPTTLVLLQTEHMISTNMPRPHPLHPAVSSAPPKGQRPPNLHVSAKSEQSAPLPNHGDKVVPSDSEPPPSRVAPQWWPCPIGHLIIAPCCAWKPQTGLCWQTTCQCSLGPMPFGPTVQLPHSCWTHDT